MILVRISEGDDFIELECDASDEAASVLEQIARDLRIAKKVRYAGIFLAFRTAGETLNDRLRIDAIDPGQPG